jgi:SAM-dependent methyltransferase
VIGDVRDLPFNDHEFDVVATVDLLEHVPAHDRARALEELARVARRRLVVACPVGAVALDADRRLAERLEHAGRVAPGWIGEHLANGFPAADEITRQLAPYGTLRAVPNLSLARHVQLMAIELSVVAYVPSRLAAAALGTAWRQGGRARRAVERVLDAVRGQDRVPVYRVIFCLDLRA